PDVKQKSEALDRKGSDKAAKELADSMGKALEKLTPEERKKLADKLKEQAKSGGMSQGDPQDLKDLADKLSTPDGQNQLERELKDLANAYAESSEGKRQKQLDDAEDGAGKTEDDIGKQGQEGKKGQSGGEQSDKGEKGEKGQKGQKGEGGDKGEGENG